jgi:hypothetical protein
MQVTETVGVLFYVHHSARYLICGLTPSRKRWCPPFKRLRDRA